MEFVAQQGAVFAFRRESAKSASGANPRSGNASSGGTGGNVRNDAADATPTRQKPRQGDKAEKDPTR
jgi:hypothetical protein